jgi:hypothetical protein
MAWAMARERLGAELIGAREQVADRWRAAVRESGLVAHSLLPIASELVLHAGAGLADDALPESPWCRCGGLLRIDGRDGGRALLTELTLLWRCMGQALTRVACTSEEEQAARDVLGKQLDAALRGATAQIRAALLDEELEDALRFGGVVAVSFCSPDGDAGVEKHAAA